MLLIDLVLDRLKTNARTFNKREAAKKMNQARCNGETRISL